MWAVSQASQLEVPGGRGKLASLAPPEQVTPHQALRRIPFSRVQPPLSKPPTNPRCLEGCGAQTTALQDIATAAAQRKGRKRTSPDRVWTAQTPSRGVRKHGGHCKPEGSLTSKETLWSAILPTAWKDGQQGYDSRDARAATPAKQRATRNGQLLRLSPALPNAE